VYGAANVSDGVLCIFISAVGRRTRKPRCCKETMRCSVFLPTVHEMILRLLFSLEEKRGDLIKTYKILAGKEDIDRYQLFQLAPNLHSTRGHQLKLFKKPCRINVRKFFSQSVLDS